MTLRYLEGLRVAGKAHKTMWQGREHWVVPVVALMEGVIHAVNSANAEFVPFKTFSQNVSQWNGRPLMLGHPVRDGIHIAANEPSVLESACFGSLFNTRIENKRLLMDAYVDPDRLKTLGREDVLERVINGQPIEISVGAQVATDTLPGEHNGRKYKNSWLAMAADHLAFLPDGRGACSLEMGCGAHRAMAAVKKDCPTCNGSGNTGGNPCDACDGSGELKVAEDIKGDEMDKKALITKLVACPCSGFTKDDITALENFSDARLVTLSETSEARAKEKEAEDDAKAKARAKQDAEDAKLKAAEDAKQTAEQKITALEAAKSAADLKITALETEMISVRDIVAERRAQDAAETTTLLATLKVAAANVYTEVELTAMPLSQLRKLALLTKVDVPDYSGRGITVSRVAGAVDYNPPNAYDAGIKILQGK